jgi:signal peptidase II
VLILIADQALKFWIKTTFSYGDEIMLLGWDKARLHFVENNGMAFGMSLGGSWGKLLLSLFRIIAVGFLIYYLRFLIKHPPVKFGLLACFALILAGALGNIIDSAFYGMIFSESVPGGPPAVLFPEGGGYAGFLHGRVVDMFYFPLFQGNFPEWLPFWGGEYFIFFRPVFNVADSAISVGVISLILFHRSFFSSPPQKVQKETASAAAIATDAAPEGKIETGSEGDSQETP